MLPAAHLPLCSNEEVHLQQKLVKQWGMLVNVQLKYILTVVRMMYWMRQLEAYYKYTTSMTIQQQPLLTLTATLTNIL
jgi:hypothetical protein